MGQQLEDVWLANTCTVRGNRPKLHVTVAEKGHPLLPTATINHTLMFLFVSSQSEMDALPESTAIAPPLLLLYHSYSEHCCLTAY